MLADVDKTEVFLADNSLPAVYYSATEGPLTSPGGTHVKSLSELAARASVVGVSTVEIAPSPAAQPAETAKLTRIEGNSRKTDCWSIITRPVACVIWTLSCGFCCKSRPTSTNETLTH